MHTWYIGILAALYWSLLSVYTSSVAKAYFLPLRGLDEAGVGGKSWPSKSMSWRALPSPLSFLPRELSGAGEAMAVKISLSDESAGRCEGMRSWDVSIIDIIEWRT